MKKNNKAEQTELPIIVEEQKKIEIVEIKDSGFLWRGKDKFAIWATAKNGFIFVLKSELEKPTAYSVQARVAREKTINPEFWSKVGFVRQEQPMEEVPA